MALPTLRHSHYYVPLRDRNSARVQKMANRTMLEDERRKQWSENTRYFKNADVNSRRTEVWTSQDCFKNSLLAYNSKINQQQKDKRLGERKEALRALLENERLQLEEEMKGISKGDEHTTMKNRAEQLRSAREERRKKLAHEKYLDHWRLNCPELREVESRQIERATHKEWENQIEKKQEERDILNRDEKRYEEEIEIERMKALRLEEEEKIKKKREERLLSEQLKRQMLEVKAKEEESAILEHQQAVVMREQYQLHKAEEERRELEEQQRKLEFGRLLVKQAKAQLRRKCKQIQEALELDLKILEGLAEKEKEEEALATARREKEQFDAIWMKKVMEEQLALEKERELQLDLIYQEEAAKMWSKREQEWQREKEARESLMADVLAERQHQLYERLENLKIRQQESIEEREKLLRDIEISNQLTARENREKENLEKTKFKELKSQITERRRKEEELKLQHEWEIEQERLAEKEHEEMIQQEQTRMTARPYQFQYHGRVRPPQYAWY